MDNRSKEARSRNMSRIPSKNTKPEETVRKYLFSQGFRYRKNMSKLPGKPDIVLPKYKTVIFVNGCFWHAHQGCKWFVPPKSNNEFWEKKFAYNTDRDTRNYKKLEELGWRVIIVWECEIRHDDPEERIRKLSEEIRGKSNKVSNVVEVVAALVWDMDKFMICQRPTHKARALLWEFVGGKVEPGETKEQALIRECQEELAITLSVGDVFMDVVHEYPDITIHLTLFNATIAEGMPQKLEHNDIRWITPNEISNYEFCPADEEILERIIENSSLKYQLVNS